MIDDVERYAQIAAALANADDRARVLSDNGLTEEQWEEIDGAWQAQLSEAVDAFDDDGVPELVSRFSDAYARAGEAAAVLPFEKFLEVTRALQRSQDVLRTLQSHQVTFAMFTRANQHWAVKISTDVTLAERLRKALE